MTLRSIAIIGAFIVLAAFVFYRSCVVGHRLDVDPNARRQIEKAKRR